MRRQGKRWLRQAEADLKAARDSLAAGNFEWSCFQAQQAGEKALKAYLYGMGYTSVMTHSLKELLGQAKKLNQELEAVASAARSLDMYYVPTRYPNGLAGELAPTDFYEREDAEKCVGFAESILNAVRSSWPP